jgi:mycoredoxin
VVKKILHNRDAVEPNGARVNVYGTEWCAATQMVRRYLDRLELAYIFRDLDIDAEATRQVRWGTGGDASHPTLQIDGAILVEPNLAELQSALARSGLV